MRKLSASHSDSTVADGKERHKSELNRRLSFGRGDSVILKINNTEERKTIIHENGDFSDFPGIAVEDMDEINDYLQNGSLAPNVRYSTAFTPTKDGGWHVTWCVQPDGRYWEDEDGYGGENDKEINLYSHLSDDGRFTQPFKLHSIGAVK